jgi:NitT/TauT family transport system permease protein
LPILFAGFKTGITMAVIGAVVGEFVGASGGLGYLTIYAAGLMNTPLVFAAILQLTIIGILLYAFMSWLERKIVPWYNTENESP